MVAPHAGLNFTAIGRGCTVYVHTTFFSGQSTLYCVISSYVWNVEHLPVAVDDSVADRFLPESCGGSNSKERLQTTDK